MTGFARTRRVFAVAAFASLGLATGCASARSIDDGSAVVAAAEAPMVVEPMVVESTVVESTAAATSPSLPTLQELLAQDRFVPLDVALERSGLHTVIDGLDDFVLLAPTGTAFVSIATDIGIDYSALMNTPRLLEAVMRYHIVADPATNPSWRTLNGSVLDVDVSDDMIERVDGVEVLERIPVRNGTVLAIPRFLLPTPQQGITGPEAQRAD